ncbi:MAG: hypothetical protein ACF8R7_12405 [Phycisphaerales bacterium JB039]
MARQPGHRRLRLVAGAALLWVAGAGAQVEPASLPPRVAEAVVALSDEQAPEEARLQAARALVGAQSDAARGFAADLLATAEETDPRPGLLLRALAEAPVAALRPTLLAGVRPESGWPEARRIGAIRALGAEQGRETVAALIERLDPREPSAVRSAATAALIRITGRDDDDARRRGEKLAWEAWFADRALLPEHLWLSELAAGCAARAERLAAAKRDVESQYRRTMEQLYQASDSEARISMLLAMLQEPLAPIRQLGLDLVERALNSGQRVAPEVAGRVVELLGDPVADIRGRSAVLVDRLRPEGAGAKVAEAVLRETDPLVAGRLLLALRNWPTPVARDVVLRWLEHEDPTIRRRAAAAALAAHEAGLMEAEQDRQRILTALRRPAPETLSREGMELLCALGDESDREMIASLLASPDSAVRLLAAQIVARDPAQHGRLLAAAASDAQLVPVAIEAIAGNSPTLEDYDTIAALIPAEDTSRDDRLAQLAAGLGLPDLLQVASRMPANSPFADRILARCVEMASAINGAEPEHPETLARALLLLTEIRLGLNRPDMALAAVEVIRPSWATDLTPEIDHARTVALLWLGRLDDPRLAESPEAWLSALERCVEQQLPHSAQVHEAMLRFTETLSDEQRARLAEYGAAIRTAAAEGGAGGAEIDDPPAGGGG